ncbi:MAG TPA: hypothetical protein VLQ45_13055, partial [Thermoanaerobaculia bacterium]|nr:hypothetical protein [Thermoanaerobaculia bacterium]
MTGFEEASDQLLPKAIQIIRFRLAQAGGPGQRSGAEVPPDPGQHERRKTGILPRSIGERTFEICAGFEQG